MRSSALVAALVATALPALAGCEEREPAVPVADVSMQPDDGLHGVLLPTPYDVPHTTLTDTHGGAYTLDTDSTRPVTLVFFGYTSCPDTCRMVMANLAAALTRLIPAQQARVAMLFVTTDPARDDARTLRTYLDRYNPRFEGLTGPLPRIEAAGTALGVPISAGRKLPSGGYEVDHGTQVIAVRPDGTAPVVWTDGTPPADIAADLVTILDHGVPTPAAGGAQ